MEQIEETLFARKRWVESKMTAYGFQKVKDGYTLEKPFMGGDFKAVLSLDTIGTCCPLPILWSFSPCFQPEMVRPHHECEAHGPRRGWQS